MKYYEILPTHTETPRNTTYKIANLYIEFNYHFLTLQKKIPLLLNRSVLDATQIHWVFEHCVREKYEKKPQKKQLVLKSSTSKNTWLRLFLQLISSPSTVFDANILSNITYQSCIPKDLLCIFNFPSSYSVFVHSPCGICFHHRLYTSQVSDVFGLHRCVAAYLLIDTRLYCLHSQTARYAWPERREDYK